MVNEKKEKNEIERRRLLERALSIVLSGMLAMSVCGTTMVAFASDDTGLISEGLRTEKASESYSVAFATGNASVSCNGATITGQQAMTVAAEKDLVFTVAPHDGFTVEDVSLQLLVEGVLDVLAPTEAVEGAQYTVAADRLADGVAIVIDTAAIEGEGAASVPEPVDDRIKPPVTGRAPSANVKDVEKVYDGQPVSVEASADENGATLLYYADGMSGWSAENPRFTDAGTYTVLVKAIGTSNSETDVVTAHVTVKPAPVVIKVRDAEKTFGSADPAFGGVIEGLVPGDDIGSVVYYRLNNGVEEVGSYADVLSALVQHRNGNYAYTVTPGSFTIGGGVDASVRNQMGDPMIPADPSDPGQSAAANSSLVTEFAQGEGMQYFAEGLIEPIATLLGVPTAHPTTTIIDDDNPLAAFEDDAQKGCWVHLWIILGALVTAVGGAIAVLRRLQQTWHMDVDLDEVFLRDMHLEDEDALPALDALSIR